VIYEHLHRYVLAAELASGRNVLDLGSGEGYGAAILAQVAHSVTGIEIDADSVEHARRRYRAANLEFMCRSVLDLEYLDDASFDLIVCFEMIEHIGEQDTLVASARRLLKTGGLLLVSTPDREIYSDATDYHNPFHVKEMSRREFESLLSQQFEHLALWTQSVVVGSILRSLGPELGQLDHGVGIGLVEGEWQQQPVAAPPYLLAVASNLPLPVLPTVSILHDGGALAQLSSSREPWAGSEEVPGLYELWGEDRLRRQVAIYEAAIAEETAARRWAQLEVAEGEQARRELRGSLENREAEIQRLEARLREIERSRAWHMVTRYRRLREFPRTGRRRGSVEG
jgi:SAM-dependent methyltransferase